MKPLFVISILFAFSVLSEAASAQTTCDLTAWMKALPPHTQRTPEMGPPILRDTTFMVNGVSRRVSIPAGFTISQFARVSQCRGLACSPDGVIYATSYDSGRVLALPDHDHDGTPDSVLTLIKYLSNPHGVGFYNNELYFSDVTHLYRAETAPGSRLVTNRTTLGTFPSGGHISRNFVVDSANHRFLLQVGSASNMDESDLEHRATVQCFDIVGGNFTQRTFAKGLRNPVGMDLDPRTGALWVNNNGMDDLFGSGNPRSNDNPSECVYLLCDGANYGWPYAYGYQMRNPRSPFVNLDTNIVQTFSGPVAEVLAHEAPLGLHFYRGSTFPQMYHNAIFQCYHGSWDRTPPAPPRVTVMWADSDGRNARVTDFINGFQPDSNNGRWSRPVSVIEGADSALYISDDFAGAIYRVRWTGLASEVARPRYRTSALNPVPNPGRAEVTIPVSLADTRQVSIEVYDETGKLQLQRPAETLPAGEYRIPISTSTLSSGNYVVQIALDHDIFTQRLVVLR